MGAIVTERKRLPDIAERVFAYLKEAAEAGEPCPGNRGLALACEAGLGSIERAFLKLADARRIEIESNPRFRTRRVTIPGIGATEWTAPRQYVFGKERHAQPITGATDPWNGNCFSSHNIDPGDRHRGRIPERPPTTLPTVGVLA